MTSTPTIVYKYLSFETAKKVLNGKQLRITPPNDFNDPFEMLPRGYTGLSDAAFREKADRICRTQNHHAALQAKGVFQGSFSDYLIWLNNNPDVIEHVAMATKRAFETRDFRELLNKSSELFGVFCCSTRSDNILMWSHYADEHKGVVLAFDSAKLASQWFKVNYQDERVDLPFDMEAGDTKHKQAVIDVMITKKTLWSYENEYRCLRRLTDCVKKDVNGKDMYFMPIPDDCIRQVVIGCRMPQVNIDVLKSLVDVAKVSMITAEMDRREFKINLV